MYICHYIVHYFSNFQSPFWTFCGAPDPPFRKWATRGCTSLAKFADGPAIWRPSCEVHGETKFFGIEDFDESDISEIITEIFLDFECQEKVCGCDMVLAAKMTD